MTIVEEPEVAAATPEFERAAGKAASRRGFFMALPTFIYLGIFFAIPLVIVFVYSFAVRNRFGEAEFRDWNLDAYRKLADPLVRDIVLRSLLLAVITTLICLIVGYPFAYFLATRRPLTRNVALVFVMIPFWSNFLVRNYAWRVLLGTDGPVSRLTEATTSLERQMATPNNDGMADAMCILARAVDVLSSRLSNESKDAGHEKKSAALTTPTRRAA